MPEFSILLLVPTVSLAVFVVLGLGPIRLWRSYVQILALLGVYAPLMIMLALTIDCVYGPCKTVAPVFTIVGGNSVVALALLLDPLSAVVGLTVTTIGACVMTYAVSYMNDAKMADLRRFFALMNLFIAAMMSMVLAGDSIVFFLGWEMMGLCSYFLIAYNTTSPQANAAGRKAFIMTRFADAPLLAALLLLFLEANSVRLDALIPAGVAMDEHRRTIVACLLLIGAIGKSAQVPLHTWLPSAMAGPTPVSALLHSATMVTAGVFLMVRFAPVMAAVPDVQLLTAVVGVVTAAFGALSAIFQTDVKRLLAYSSISQIGMMMLSIGAGAPQAAVAHFVVHAMFKSLLFLAAGDITHGAPQGTSMVSMRGARQRKPLAFATFAVGAASLAALPVVTAGWWSKEAILASVFQSSPFGIALGAVALASAVMTGIYAFRPVLIGLEDERGPAGGHGAGEGSKYGSRLITTPMLLLATGAVLGGLLVSPVIHFLGGEAPEGALVTVVLAALAPLLGAWIAISPGTFVRPLARVLARIRRPQDSMPQSEAMAPLIRIAQTLGEGKRLDRFYRIAVAVPFARLVRRLNGYGGGMADPLGSLVVAGATRLKEVVVAPLAPDGVWMKIGSAFAALATRSGQWLKKAIVAPLARDAFDRLWMKMADTVVWLGSATRQVQTGRVRDYGVAMATGAAALLLLAWGTA